MNECHVLGAGGHASVMIETLKRLKVKHIFLYDNDPDKLGIKVNGIVVKKLISELDKNFAGPAVIAIGNNGIRKKLAEQFKNCCWAIIIDPSAIVAENAVVKAGTVVMAGALIQPGTVIGTHTIINSSASIDHDCEIADYVHICPAVSFAGNVKVGAESMVGIGSCVIPGVTIGSECVIGAGSVLIRDIADGVKVAGNPAVKI